MSSSQSTPAQRTYPYLKSVLPHLRGLAVTPGSPALLGAPAASAVNVEIPHSASGSTTVYVEVESPSVSTHTLQSSPRRTLTDQ